MLHELQKVLDMDSFFVEVIDIDQDPELQKQYAARIPLLFHGDKVLAEYFLDPEKVREIFRQQD